MINNKNKSTENNFPSQIVAGIMKIDTNIEFVGVPRTKTVIYLQQGCVKNFTELPLVYFEMIKKLYKDDKKALEFLSSVTDDFSRQVEIFTYYMWGDLDENADIKNGKLTAPENFRESENCPSLLWNKKDITINGEILTPREILITDLFAKNIPDKTIASNIGICHSHFDKEKKKLFTKVGVNTKPTYMVLATQQKVIRNAI